MLQFKIIIIKKKNQTRVTHFLDNFNNYQLKPAGHLSVVSAQRKMEKNFWCTWLRFINRGRLIKISSEFWLLLKFCSLKNSQPFSLWQFGVLLCTISGVLCLYRPFARPIDFDFRTPCSLIQQLSMIYVAGSKSIKCCSCEPNLTCKRFPYTTPSSRILLRDLLPGDYRCDTV